MTLIYYKAHLLAFSIRANVPMPFWCIDFSAIRKETLLWHSRISTIGSTNYTVWKEWYIFNFIIFTWLTCGAATNMTGPSFGILCAPLGLISRKKVFNIKLNNQKAISYVNLWIKVRIILVWKRRRKEYKQTKKKVRKINENNYSTHEIVKENLKGNCLSLVLFKQYLNTNDFPLSN